MLKVIRYGALLAVAGCLLLAQSLLAADGIKGNLVSVNWLEKNLKNSDVLILDGSPTQIYTAKHISGAVSVDIYTWYGLQEMPVADMEKLCQSWGISLGKKIVMYDQGGTMLATRIFYSLYYYGFPAKDLFILDGGLFKWQEAGLPVTKDVTPVPKKGSFTIKKVNEDVRVYLPEFLAASGDPVNNVLLEALGADWHFGEVAPFNRAGHVPHAVLLPSADFYNPDKLAEILGPAGVNASQEAVVISGAGLTKESALAFVMLEKLGQKKISVFMDFMDKWAKLGFAVKTDATVVGPKKAPQDLSIPPTTYPGNFRKDVIIEDPKSTQGVYPKVFIASGKDVPAKAQDGKVVHVPYADLLNADGTPKAAKDIWNILAKAEVPIYAELVCYSDDPGEAAVNYFILKLMGYPDIKVLVI